MTNQKAIYPGSFDPVTLGHLDIIKRASACFSELTVVVANNNSKSAIFSVDEKVSLLKQAVADFDNVKVASFDGLIVDYANSINANIIVRGIRNSSDFDFETQLAAMNQKMSPDLNTVFITPSAEVQFIAATIVRQIASLNGELAHFVPPHVEHALRQKFVHHKH